MVTLKQLSKELGVSISTVSKALQDSYEINVETKKRVKALAEKYNYRPNKFARSLRDKQTKTIGVIIPNILNYFFAKVLQGIEKEASKRGYQIIICLSNNKYKKEIECLELLSDGSVDGFILSMAKETQKKEKTTHFRKAIDKGYPITMFDRVSDAILDCNKIVIDDKKATYEATEYLYKSKRKKIALVTSIKDVSIGKLRIEGYKEAIKDCYKGLVMPIIISINSKKEYESAISSLFSDYDDVDGIITTDNTGASVALKVAHKKGHTVPKDISIIGFSDDKISRLVHPALTIIDQNPLEIGKQSVISLINTINNKSVVNTKVVETNLIVRQSTR